MGQDWLAPEKHTFETEKDEVKVQNQCDLISDKNSVFWLLGSLLQTLYLDTHKPRGLLSARIDPSRQVCINTARTGL